MVDRDEEKDEFDRIDEEEHKQLIDELDDEAEQAREHLCAMRRILRRMKASCRAIKEIEDLVSKVSGLWLLDFGSDDALRPDEMSGKKQNVEPKIFSDDELREIVEELAYKIEEWVSHGENLEWKLRDYIRNASVTFDSDGNVIDGSMHLDWRPWTISPRGVIGTPGLVGTVASKIMTGKIYGIAFTCETSKTILELLKKLHEEGRTKDSCDDQYEDENDDN